MGALPTEIAFSRLQIQSADWTGIELRLDAQPELTAQISKKVQELDALVELAGLTNVEHRRAKAITESLIKLVNSPQPEWRIIVELLTSKPMEAIATFVGIADIILGLIFS